MGNIFGRKPKTTLDVLENLDKSIDASEDYKKITQLSQKRYMAYLIIFSSLVYFFAVIVGYFYYYPRTAGDVFLRLIPLFLFPFLIFGLKTMGCWWFVLRLEANEQALDRLRRKRRELLENVKNKEVYNVAKEILEKYDPNLQAERLKMERKAEEEKFKELQLRQRMTAALNNINTNNLPTSPSRTGQEIMKNGGHGQPSILTPRPPIDAAGGMMGPGGPRLPRPLMPQHRTALDKIVDYFLVDGPNNRYALICAFCHNHNGMALLEDFEYLSYNCAYCFYYNPAKKQRKKLSAHELAPKDQEGQKVSTPLMAMTSLAVTDTSSTCASIYNDSTSNGSSMITAVSGGATNNATEIDGNTLNSSNLRSRRMLKNNNGSTNF